MHYTVQFFVLMCWPGFIFIPKLYFNYRENLIQSLPAVIFLEDRKMPDWTAFSKYLQKLYLFPVERVRDRGFHKDVHWRKRIFFPHFKSLAIFPFFSCYPFIFHINQWEKRQPFICTSCVYPLASFHLDLSFLMWCLMWWWNEEEDLFGPIGGKMEEQHEQAGI